MSLILIFSIGLISTVLLFLKKRLLGSLLLVVEVILIFSIWSGIATEYVLNQFQIYPHLTQPEWKNNNLIILLGYGSTRWTHDDKISSYPLEVSRLYEAARLYTNCREHKKDICKILVSGGDPQRFGKPEARVMADELIAIGIPEIDLVLEDESRNTFFNARYSKKIISEQFVSPTFDQIFLVTSGIHMRRSLQFFNFFDLDPIPAPASHLKPLKSYSVASRNFFLLDSALHEALGIAQFHYYNMRGWNKKN